jgi:hypothetical protein
MSFLYVDGQIDLSLSIVPIEFYCVLCEQTIRTTTMFIATLTLGLRPKQGLARLRAKKKPRSERKCEGMNPHTPKRASILGVWSSKFQWTPKFSKGDCKGQNPMIEEIFISLKIY